MESLRCLAVLISCIFAISAAPQAEIQIKILSQSSELNPDGSYSWKYDTENGIKAEETGTIQKARGPDEEDSIGAQGAYSYTDLEGNQIGITYTADKDGFQPVGAHLPTSPPIPPEIQKALDWLLTQPSTTERAGQSRK